jgi:hypothetical protein
MRDVWRGEWNALPVLEGLGQPVPVQIGGGAIATGADQLILADDDDGEFLRFVAEFGADRHVQYELFLTCHRCLALVRRQEIAQGRVAVQTAACRIG